MVRATLLAPVLAWGLVAFAPAPARAGLLPVSVSVTPEADKYRWTYAIVLPTDSQLSNGDYFTIYDFKGYVDQSAVAPAGWAFTTSKLGPTPPLVTPTDDPAIPNLSFRYVGDTVTAGQTGLGNFVAVSDFQLKADSYFTAKTGRTSDGKVDSNITTTSVPVPSGDVTPPSGVPEPASLALAALGLPFVGAARWLRRKKA